MIKAAFENLAVVLAATLHQEGLLPEQLAAVYFPDIDRIAFIKAIRCMPRALSPHIHDMVRELEDLGFTVTDPNHQPRDLRVAKEIADAYTAICRSYTQDSLSVAYQRMQRMNDSTSLAEESMRQAQDRSNIFFPEGAA